MAITLDGTDIKLNGSQFPVKAIRRVSTEAALKALTPSDQEVAVYSNALWQYDVSSSASTSSTVIAPNSGTGRWIRADDVALPYKTTTNEGVAANPSDGTVALRTSYANSLANGDTLLIDTNHAITGNVGAGTTQQTPNTTVLGVGWATSKISFDPGVSTDALFNIDDGAKTVFADFWIAGDGSTGKGFYFGSVGSFTRGIFDRLLIEDVDVGIDFSNGFIHDFNSVFVQRSATADFRVDATNEVNAINIFGGAYEGGGVGGKGFDLDFNTLGGQNFTWFGPTIEGHTGPEIEVHGKYRLLAGWGMYLEKSSAAAAIDEPVIKMGTTSGDNLGTVLLDGFNVAAQNEINFDRIASLHIRGLAQYRRFTQLIVGPNVKQYSIARPWNLTDDPDWISTYFQSKRNQSQVPVFTSDMRYLSSTDGFPISAGGGTNAVNLDDEGHVYLEFNNNTAVSLDTTTYLSGGQSVKVAASASGTTGIQITIDWQSDATFFDEWLDNDKLHIAAGVKWDDGVSAPYFELSYLYYDGSTDQTYFPTTLGFTTDKQLEGVNDRWHRIGIDIDKADVEAQTNFQYIKEIRLTIRPLSSGATTASDAVWLDWLEIYNCAYGPVFISDATDANRYPISIHPKQIKADTITTGTIEVTSAAPSSTIVNTTRDLVPPSHKFWTVGTLPTPRSEYDYDADTWAGYGDDDQMAVVLEDGPHGYEVPVHQSTSTADSGGGGVHTPLYTISPNRSYRFQIYVKASANLATDDLAFGVLVPAADSDVTSYFDGSAATTANFWSGDLPALDTWYLLVGHVMAYGATTGTANVATSGIYDCSTGEKVVDGSLDFVWASDSSQAKIYARHVGSSAGAVREYYCPAIYELDGNEPSIASLIKSPITQSALTAADGSTVDGTYGAEEQAVISNNVTRIAEIEAALQAYGILPS